MATTAIGTLITRLEYVQSDRNVNGRDVGGLSDATMPFAGIAGGFRCRLGYQIAGWVVATRARVAGRRIGVSLCIRRGRRLY